MADFAERIQEVIEDTGATVTELSIKTGIGASTISRYISGRFEPKQDKLKKLADALDVNPDWLMGEDVPKKKTDYYYNNILPLVTKKVPMLGEIACGEPILAIENIMDFVTVPSSIYADMALICKGESMTGARIFDGDLVYIRAQEDVDNGEIAAVLIGDEATLKRVYKFPGVGFVLSAENPAYEDMIYKEADAEQVHIIGKAVAFTSTVR